MNSEAINDRAKLILHRLLARRLKDHPELVEQAKAVLDRMARTSLHKTWVDEWREILELPVEEIRRRITRRDEHGILLRVNSPFGDLEGGVTDVATRARLWRKAKAGLSARSKT